MSSEPEAEREPLFDRGNVISVTDCRTEKKVLQGAIAYAAFTKGAMHIILDTGYYVKISEPEKREEAEKKEKETE